MKNIIAIYGKCGAGKTTISKILQKRLNIKDIYDIGKYRRKLKITCPEDDVFAWLELGKQLVLNKEDVVIYTTTGLNSREDIIDTVLDTLKFNYCHIVKILLDCLRPVLLKRLKERGKVSDKYFPYEGLSFERINGTKEKDKNEFDLILNTNHTTPNECANIILRMLKK